LGHRPSEQRKKTTRKKPPNNTKKPQHENQEENAPQEKRKINFKALCRKKRAHRDYPKQAAIRALNSKKKTFRYIKKEFSQKGLKKRKKKKKRRGCHTDQGEKNFNQPGGGITTREGFNATSKKGKHQPTKRKIKRRGWWVAGRGGRKGAYLFLRGLPQTMEKKGPSTKASINEAGQG